MNLLPNSCRTTWALSAAGCLFLLTSAAHATSLKIGSLSSDGTQGDGPSGAAAVSGDGRYIAFDTDASNLVTGDTIGHTDVLRRDLKTNITERVSVGANGSDSNGNSTSPSLSKDGRYVAFTSTSSDVVANDTNNCGDIFVRDMQTGTTKLASVTSTGALANGRSYYPSISADGRFVAFISEATNLVGGDTNASWDVFVHDMQAGTTERVSLTGSGAEVNIGLGYPAQPPSISGDGRYVAFATPAALLATDTSGWDVYVKDRQTPALIRVSVNSSGSQDNTVGGRLDSYKPSISTDGRYVAFESARTDLTPNDTASDHDVFVRDLQNDSTTLVSVGPGGADCTGNDPRISGDGTRLAFVSLSSTVVGNDSNNHNDVFLRDFGAGTTTLVSTSDEGIQGNQDSIAASLNDDGRTVAFESISSTLASDDANNQTDVFVFSDPLPTHVISGRALTMKPDANYTGVVRAGLAGAVVTVKDNSGTILGTATTDDNGNYSFNLPSGTYTLSATLERPGQPTTGMDPSTRTITVPKADVVVDRFALYSVFGIIKAPNKAGTVVNAPNITVQLINPNGVITATRVTGADGRYEFRNQRRVTFRVVPLATAAFTFPEKSVTVPTAGSTWSPAGRANIVGTRKAGVAAAGSNHSF